MKKLGNRGEDLAARFLRRKGYRVLRRNYSTQAGEIDIIARDGDTVVFVEVKARTGNLFGEPEEAVNARKRNKIRKVALGYMSSLKKEPRARFDIVCVYIRDGKKTVEHLKDAFEM